MAHTVSPIVSPKDATRLAAILEDRNRRLKHVQRPRIIPLSAEQLTVREVARRAGVSGPAVWRWQRRYAEGGVERLLREGSRKPGRPRSPLDRAAKMVVLTCAEPPGEVTPLDRPGHGGADRSPS